MRLRRTITTIMLDSNLRSRDGWTATGDPETWVWATDDDCGPVALIVEKEDGWYSIRTREHAWAATETRLADASPLDAIAFVAAWLRDEVPALVG